jgi:ABC-2 type transport system permease protein
MSEPGTSEPGASRLRVRETAVDETSMDAASMAGTGAAGTGAVRTRVGAAPRGARDLPAGRQRLGGVIEMEWIRLRTLRSAWWSTAVVIAAMIGLAVWIQYYVPGHWAHMSAADQASFDPTENSFAGLAIAELAVAVLGIMAATGEYASGMIRSTLVAVPRRGRVLAAKAAVIGLATLVLGEVTAFAAFLAGQAMLHSPAPHATLGQPGVLRAIALGGLYLPLIALLSLGIGMLVRRAAAGISIMVGLIFVLPIVLLALPSGFANSAARYLPVVIAENSLTAVKTVPLSLSPWTGLAMLLVYAAAALGAGGLLLARRDA